MTTTLRGATPMPYESALLPLKDSQWEAVRICDKHLLVAAGAGTGKTHTVVAKILYLLGVPIRDQRHATPLRLRDIAAITYTNRAAADLKEKLRKALREVGLRKEAYEVDTARIGTIHSFCGDIIREFALRTGRSPLTRVLEEGESAELLGEAARDAVLRSVEANDVGGLQDLLSEWAVGNVEQWVATLAGESDRLAALVRRRDSLGAHERTLVDLARRASDELLHRIESRSVVDFDRMIVWTRDLLRDDAQCRRLLQRRVRVLIVDEFQDVDPVQKEIAYLLGEPPSRRAECTRLMLVGDPKQSIYRFRRADVTVWRQVERDFAAGDVGRVVPLVDNFRSVAPVLAFVEHTVAKILDAPLDAAAHRDFEVPFAPVQAARTDGPTDRAVELLCIPARDDGKPWSARDARVIEAASVATRVSELRSGGVAASRIAILLASWTDLDLYQGALTRAGIPTYALRSTGFYERREIIDLIVALQAIRDPRHDLALFGFLRSPFVGVKDETLLAIATKCERPYVDRLDACEHGENALVARGVALLRRFSAMRDRLPTAELIERLLLESGYLAHLALLGEDGRQALANVRKLVRDAAALPELSVGDLLRLIEDTRARGDRVGEERLFGEHDDVVTITSVHSAKGLEWDVVFWCDLTRSWSHDNNAKLLVGRDELVLAEPDAPAKDQPEAWRAVLAQMELESLAEQKRLWYVAVTRAADRLILSGIPLGEMKKAKGCPAFELRALMPELGEAAGRGALRYDGQGREFEAIVRLADVAAIDAAAVESGASVGPVLPLETLPAPMTPVVVPLGRNRHSATELMLFDRCPRKHWFKYVAGLPEPALGARGRRREELVSAITRGQIVHDVLEHYAEELDVDALLEEAIGRWDADAPVIDEARGGDYRKILRADVDAILEDPEYLAVAVLPGARRELSFVHILAGDVVIEGQFDLIARERDGETIVILDVKTGSSEAPAAERAERYEMQRRVYVGAAAALSGATIGRFVFQFGGGQHTTARETGGETSRVLQAARGCTFGDAPLARDAAECASCGYRRAKWCPGVPMRS